MTVVGAVAALARRAAWLGRGPLAGVSVAVTRARAQASGLAARCAASARASSRRPRSASSRCRSSSRDLGGLRPARA